MSETLHPPAPEEFRPITRRDLRVTRFNRLAIAVAGTAAVVVVSTAIWALSSHSIDRSVGGGQRETSEPVRETEPWYSKLDPALPRLAEPPPPRSEEEPSGEESVPTLPAEMPPFELDEAGEDPKRALDVLSRAVASSPAIPNGSGIRVAPPPGEHSTPTKPKDVRADGYNEALDRILANASSGAAGGTMPPDVAAQERNRSFLAQAGQADGTILDQQLRMAPSPYFLTEGAVVPCVLEGGINSDLPGPIRARVRENVYDSATGRFLLIPQGTLVTGEYQSVVAFGQSRVLVAARRLIFPDGSSLLLRGMPLVDLEGYAGLADRVNRHFLRTFGSAVLMAGISAGVQVGQGSFDDDSSVSDGESPREVLAAALAQQLGEVSSEVIRKNLGVQPTIEIRPGYRFNVFVTQDLVLPAPYRPRYAREVRAK